MEINDKLYRIITRDGFEREFWADLHQCRGHDLMCTRRGVYEALEAMYEKEFGERKFATYEAFSKYCNRKTKKRTNVPTH